MVNTEKTEIIKKNDPGVRMNFESEDIEKRILEEDGLLRYIEKYNTL